MIKKMLVGAVLSATLLSNTTVAWGESKYKVHHAKIDSVRDKVGVATQPFKGDFVTSEDVADASVKTAMDSLNKELVKAGLKNGLPLDDAPSVVVLDANLVDASAVFSCKDNTIYTSANLLYGLRFKDTPTGFEVTDEPDQDEVDHVIWHEIGHSIHSVYISRSEYAEYLRFRNMPVYSGMDKPWSERSYEIFAEDFAVSFGGKSARKIGLSPLTKEQQDEFRKMVVRFMVTKDGYQYVYL